MTSGLLFSSQVCDYFFAGAFFATAFLAGAAAFFAAGFALAVFFAIVFYFVFCFIFKQLKLFCWSTLFFICRLKYSFNYSAI
jgi:hypothetical protein